MVGLVTTGHQSIVAKLFIIYHYYHKFETHNQENAVIYQTSIKKSQAFLITDDIGRGGAIVREDHQRPINKTKR